MKTKIKSFQKKKKILFFPTRIRFLRCPPHVEDCLQFAVKYGKPRLDQPRHWNHVTHLHLLHFCQSCHPLVTDFGVHLFHLAQVRQVLFEVGALSVVVEKVDISTFLVVRLRQKLQIRHVRELLLCERKRNVKKSKK